MRVSFLSKLALRPEPASQNLSMGYCAAPRIVQRAQNLKSLDPKKRQVEAFICPQLLLQRKAMHTMSNVTVEMDAATEKAATEFLPSPSGNSINDSVDIEKAQVSSACFPTSSIVAESLTHENSKVPTIGSWKKYQTYDLPVDPEQNDKASTIRLLSFKRPHMRAFHFSWWCYHVAFLMW